MWTPAKNSSITTTLNSPRHMSTRFDEDLPQLFKNQRYNSLYNSIHETEKVTKKYVQDQQEKNKNKYIKQAISKKLEARERKISFMNKFSLTEQKDKRKFKSESQVGKTKTQQNQQQLQLFFMDHRKAFNLLEQARLIQFFLTNQQKTKTKVDYLKKRPIRSQHRRLSLPYKEKQKMFLGKDQKDYNHARKNFYIKHDQLLDKAFKSAKKNQNFLRSQNYALKQYVLNQDVRNLIQNTELQEHSIEQQIEHNDLRKIYLNFAEGSQSHRIYYDYISIEAIPNLIDTIQKLAQNYRVTNNKLQQIVDYILYFKYKKVLYYQDLKQIFTTISQKFQINMIQRFKQKMPQIFQNQVQNYRKQNAKMIQGVLKKSKIDIGIKLLFQSQSQKIIGKKYLPLHAIQQIMKNAKIIPKIITMCKFYHTCLSEAKRYVGYNLQEFKSIQLNLALSLQCSKKGLQDYMQMLDLCNFAAIY